MTTADFNIRFSVDQTPKEVFNAVNNVRGWWTEIEGSSQKLNDVFTIRFGQIFITHKIVEFVPDQKVVWHVTASNVDEWKNTRICFEILRKNNSTEMNFTHVGMLPGLKEYEGVEKGWNKFINENLFKLITKNSRIPA